LYLTEYDRLFKDYRDKPVRLLEIGIQNGGSLDIWSKYFSNAAVLIGCDINPDCARLSYDDPRIGVVIGDANAPEVRKQVFKHSPQFDIVIDDGSHLSSDIVKSFALYFQHVVEGGIFIAEDLHCSYWIKFEGWLFDP
jgi:cephalosporin hydroxylase